MCDERTEKENEAYFARKGISRRDVARLGIGAGFVAMLPACASPSQDVVEAGVTERDVVITTPDGDCDAHFAFPAQGAHAAVLVWPDIMGLRPAFRMMGKRLAESGYAVLTVNPFYRSAKAPVIEPGQSFRDPDVRTKLVGYRRAVSTEGMVSDAKAFVDWLDAQDEVDTSKKIGTTGYCMGGPYVMRTAGNIPERIGAGGSFHGGGLATEGEDSPHLLIPNMEAGMLIAIAENDDEQAPQVKTILKDAFAANDVPAEVEVYEGAMHGWCPPDSAVYNEEQAEKAWSRLLALFETHLA
ncbi:MAG: dienelactone hydrolase [Ponticaulis sp.]|nr:dienelactone hydrolase [Ponticaulis sp.]|tara:strand:- start:23234 stop:24127 length:894 start_codon:yes stop_codon:yes gene_type:complete